MLQRLTDELGPRGLAFVTVALEGAPARYLRMARRLGLTAPVVVGDTPLRKEFLVTSYPWSVVIGKDGRARDALRGGHSEATFRDRLERALE